MTTRLTAAAMCLCAGSLLAPSALAQTQPPARAIPFTETFASGVPTNFAGWNGMSGSALTSQALAEASTPTGDASIVSGAPGSSGALYYESGSRIGMTYSTNASNGANQWAFAFDASNSANITLEYDLITTDGSQGRPAQMVAQYRVGTSGAWTTLPSVAGNPFTSGATGSVQHVTMTVPAAAENQAVVQVRFANWRGGGSGSSCRYAIDNVSVTGSGVDPNAGACCIADGSCVTNLLADCNTAGGTFQGMGTSCSMVSCPQPPGSCCVTGTGCVLVTSPAECTSMSGTNFIMNGLCNPGPCIPPAPVAVALGDFALATNNTAATSTMFQIRGVGAASPAVVGSWQQFAFIEYVRFDNAGGVNHNRQGNLLGLNFGNGGGGGPLYTYSTDGTNNALPIVDQAGFNAIVADPTNSRVGGLSVSPDNNRIAVTGYDAARIAVLTYSAGGSVGTGGGAAVTGGMSTGLIPYLVSPKGSWGTAWLDNDTVLVAVRMGGQALSLYTLPVSGFDSSTTFGTPVARITVTDPGPDLSPQTAVAYNPQLSTYIYLLSSAFSSPATTNTLYIIDPATWTIAKQVNLSTSLQTGRDLAIGNDRNLYLSSRRDTGLPQIEKLVLDANSDGAISAGEIAALTDNSTVEFFNNNMIGNAGFTGIDIGLSAGGASQGTCCDVNGGCTFVVQANCASTWTQGGACDPNPCPQPPAQGTCCATSGACTFVTQANCAATWTQGGACDPNPCPQPPAGVCCRGATCNSGVAQAACMGNTLAGAVFATSSTSCNSGGSNTTPCCHADYNKLAGITVGDIFDFLNDWFAGSLYAIPGGDGATGTLAVQNIFDFLNAWFAGGC